MGTGRHCSAIGGSDRSGYLLATGAHAWSQGWHVVRMNMRGAGDGATVCPRPYHAGLDYDLLAAVEAVGRRVRLVAVGGFSLGANLALLALGRSLHRMPAALVAAAAVSPPLDLAASTAALESRSNGLYQWYFARNLRAAYAERQRLRPDLYAEGRERGLTTVRAYDERITAPDAGFASADEYYRLSSAGPHLRNVERPVLILAAQDDPLIPIHSVTRWPLPASGRVHCEVTPTGGHMGFYAPTDAPCRFWAAARVVRFLEEALAHG